MDFVPEQTLRDEVGRAFVEHESLIRGLIPGASIQHVGSSAVPGALTKGDLDLLVGVPAEALAGAIRSLSERYAIHQPENWTDTFASFRQEQAGEIAIGVQLVVRGSVDERIFVEWCDQLTSDPALLSDYNSFKRSQTEASPERYMAEKASFIESRLSP